MWYVIVCDGMCNTVWPFCLQAPSQCGSPSRTAMLVVCIPELFAPQTQYFGGMGRCTNQVGADGQPDCQKYGSMIAMLHGMMIMIHSDPKFWQHVKFTECCPFWGNLFGSTPKFATRCLDHSGTAFSKLHVQNRCVPRVHCSPWAPSNFDMDGLLGCSHFETHTSSFKHDVSWWMFVTWCDTFKTWQWHLSDGCLWIIATSLGWRHCADLKVTMKKDLREKLLKRIRRQQEKNPCFLSKVGADGTRQVQGTKALARTAEYTFSFTRQLMLAWRRETGY